MYSSRIPPFGALEDPEPNPVPPTGRAPNPNPAEKDAVEERLLPNPPGLLNEECGGCEKRVFE